nr:60S ribosomal protein L10-like [Saimiri boliviensis boliviensis]
MGAQCAMAANSSFLGSVCSLFLVWVALRDLGDRPSRCMFMCLTLPLPQCRLQTGMRGAFGKPQGTVARVHIGQVIMSIRTKLQNKEHVIEALRRAKFKFPGRQKIHISKKWGFTKFNADEFEDMVAEKRLIPDGCGVKYIPNRGPLDKWRALHS